MTKSLNAKEIKYILNYIIDNNNNLISQNKKPTAVEIIGESGLGKTSIISQICKERDMGFVKLNLSQTDELGDIIGFPIKEFYIQNITSNSFDYLWVSENLLNHYLALNYIIVDSVEPRMGYAPPKWVPKDANPNGGILLLDDFTRAQQSFMQAIMELIDNGTYLSWSLPKNWHIILTSNPDNGEYTVTSLDNAQKTRYVSFELEFDKNCWAEWAENEGIRGQCIDFLLMYPEILTKSEGVQKINPRSLVTFFNTISGLKNFSDTNSLYTIMLIAKGCFTTEDNVVGNLFTMFVNNNLDKLIQPEDLLFKDWKDASKLLKECIFVNKVYRTDIAATVTTRFINFISMYLNNNPDADSKVVNQRIIDIVNNEEDLLTKDLVFQLVKELVSKYPTRTNQLLMNAKIMSNIMG